MVFSCFFLFLNIHLLMIFISPVDPLFIVNYHDCHIYINLRTKVPFFCKIYFELLIKASGTSQNRHFVSVFIITKYVKRFWMNANFIWPCILRILSTSTASNSLPLYAPFRAEPVGKIPPNSRKVFIPDDSELSFVIIGTNKWIYIYAER